MRSDAERASELGVLLVNDSKPGSAHENQYIRVITPMDPQEGRWYIEPIKDEVGRGWDHAYNIFEDYIQPIVDGELEWRSASSNSSDFDDALKI